MSRRLRFAHRGNACEPHHVKALPDDAPCSSTQTTQHPTAVQHDAGWWRRAVVYQIYVRSFADSDGDGLTPFYPSPQADHGYDVADHRGVDPLFGDLAAFDELVERAHGLGLGVVVDLVPNHVSSQHPWFRAAVAAPQGAPVRGRFHVCPGRGPNGSLPPNRWRSAFGGPAWTRLPDGEWYLHLMLPEQPDLNLS